MLPSLPFKLKIHVISGFNQGKSYWGGGVAHVFRCSSVTGSSCHCCPIASTALGSSPHMLRNLPKLQSHSSLEQVSGTHQVRHTMGRCELVFDFLPGDRTFGTITQWIVLTITASS